MNYLPLLLIALLLFAKKEESYKKILSSISVTDALSLLPLLGVDEKTVSAVNEIVPAFLSGELDTTTLLKQAIPLLMAMSSQKENSSENDYSEQLPTIPSFASEEIKSSLKEYFS